MRYIGGHTTRSPRDASVTDPLYMGGWLHDTDLVGGGTGRREGRRDRRRRRCRQGLPQQLHQHRVVRGGREARRRHQSEPEGLHLGCGGGGRHRRGRTEPARFCCSRQRRVHHAAGRDVDGGNVNGRPGGGERGVSRTAICLDHRGTNLGSPGVPQFLNGGEWGALWKPHYSRRKLFHNLLPLPSIPVG